MMIPLEFDMGVTTDTATGDIISVYFQIRRGKVSQTVEYADGDALADYASNGQLLGIELLGPCSITVVDQLAANEPLTVRQRTKKFVRSGPRQMIAA